MHPHQGAALAVSGRGNVAHHECQMLDAVQHVAVGHSAELAERLQDDKSKEHLADALSQMATAVEKLKQAVAEPAREPLTGVSE